MCLSIAIIGKVIVGIFIVSIIVGVFIYISGLYYKRVTIVIYDRRSCGLTYKDVMIIALVISKFTILEAWITNVKACLNLNCTFTVVIMFIEPML